MAPDLCLLAQISVSLPPRRLKMRPFELFRHKLSQWRQRILPPQMPPTRVPKRTRTPVEQWEPIAGKISDDDWQIITSFSLHALRTRDWRKLNILRSYHPRPVTTDQFHKEFGTWKGWNRGKFDTINKQLRRGYKENLIPFRCQVVFKDGQGYKLSKMITVQ